MDNKNDPFLYEFDDVRYSTIDEIVAVSRSPVTSPLEVRSYRSLRLAALFIILGFVLLIISLAVLPWVQNVQGFGRVIAYSPNERLQTLTAPVDGLIHHWHVVEGTYVKRGDRIVDIVDIDPDIMSRLEREREAAHAKVDAAQQAIDTSKKNVDRQRSLYQKGLSSQRAAELAELEYANYLSLMSSASAELARLETRIARQASQSVTAPRDGVIQRMLAPQGGVIVKAGTDLALIVPQTPNRSVELMVSGNDVPLITVGRPVRLQFEGWPAVQFAGWPSVARGTFGGRVAVIDPSADADGKFRILVFPEEGEKWPDGRYLRQGTRVIGWVLLETVPLGKELWRQFNGFPPSINIQGGEGAGTTR
jgi:multidrug efflux pump subunit AcrA (membrane-fusion protein)